MDERKRVKALKGWHWPAAALFLAALSALAVYLPALGYPFVFDDRGNILNNIVIRDTGNFWPPLGTRYFGYLSFAVDYRLWGLNPAAFRAVNIAIHIVNSLLVFLLVRRTLSFFTREDREGLAPCIALVTALIFVVHPVQTEAVTYISQRFTSLAALFYLLALVLYLRWRAEGGRAFYLLSFIAAAVAQMTKENAFTLPFVIAAYEFAFFDKRDLKRRIIRLLPFIALLAVIPAMLLMAHSGPGAEIRAQQFEDLGSVSAYRYLITQFRVIVTYLRLIFLPVRQNLDYGLPLFDSFLDPRVFISFIFLVAVFTVALVVFLRRKNPLPSAAAFFILWFFVTISVESSVIPIQDAIFEHRLYLPGMGVIAFSVIMVFHLLGKRVPPPGAAAVVAVVVCLPLAVAARNRNYIWQSEFSLYSDVIRKSPENPRGHYNLAKVLASMGRLKEAEREYLEAIKLKKDYYEAYNNLGGIYRKSGRIEQAVRMYMKALGIRPDDKLARNNLGAALAATGRLDEAIGEYQKALKIDPLYPEARYNLARAYLAKGLLREAAAHFEIFIKTAPGRLAPYRQEARRIVRAITEKEKRERRK